MTLNTDKGVKENRIKIWDAYIAQRGLHHRSVKHMFVDYSRYHEAELILRYFIKNHIDIVNLRVLDYGCGVGDYGIYLLTAGAKQVDFYDFPRAVKFVEYRLKVRKSKNGKIVDADKDEHPNLSNYNLIIFGEVLEHLYDPLAILKQCDKARAKYIFTSAYPYCSEDANESYWSNGDHKPEARLQIPECRELLEKNYSFQKFDGELRLWIRK
ncbi:MAG: class I SAM-dependent methyltransferase [Nitrospirae bacterium]|nr:MAG: class I SAM-dependent methyltransferase [Nitrospirota bacterium]